MDRRFGAESPTCFRSASPCPSPSGRRFSPKSKPAIRPLRGNPDVVGDVWPGRRGFWRSRRCATMRSSWARTEPLRPSNLPLNSGRRGPVDRAGKAPCSGCCSRGTLSYCAALSLQRQLSIRHRGSVAHTGWWADPTAHGFLVEDVYDLGPAAGIVQVGDDVQAINGKAYLAGGDSGLFRLAPATPCTWCVTGSL